jgi:phage-related protein
MQKVFFIDGSKRRLRNFCRETRREAGYQLWRLQQGQNPHDWRAIKDVGLGAREIRMHQPHQYRVIYVALVQGIYVLHVFEKKTRRTSKHDVRVAKAAYRKLHAIQKSSRLRQTSEQ